MLAADADLEFGIRLTSLLRGHADQLSHALAVERAKGVLFHDSLLHIRRQEFVDVIARKAVGELGEIVGAKREEFRHPGDVFGDQRGARQLDHGAHQIIHAFAFLCEHLFGHALHNSFLVGHFLGPAYQRNHHLRMNLYALVRHRDRRLKNRASLHFRDFRIGDAQPAPAMPQHGIKFVQLLHARQQLASLLQAARFGIASLLQERNLHHQVFAPRQKLVQWRI